MATDQWKELTHLSQALENLASLVAKSVVRVDDGTSLTASGIIWSAEGIIVATSHGVERDEELAVELHDGTMLAATLVGRDHDSDIAVLRVDKVDLPTLEKVPAPGPKVGQLALAVARPGTFGLCATMGLVSARIETQRLGLSEHIIYTDAQFPPGFSGGALVNVQGQLLGLIDRIFARGHGVALGVPVIQHAVESLLTHGRIPHAYLGVKIQTVSLPPHLQNLLGVHQDKAVMCVHIETDSAAERAGLLPGDILLAIADTPITDPVTLRRVLRTLQAGQTVELKLVRGGVLTTLQITLGNAL
ncbi:trypsin-like serine protease with C-terminal PDZ domain [Chthonomonas calidirosea]|uniref:S1C family serine protease n=1 Tax=Chthonomonas calidirosea TaxID=454171 RepID=UPI0006DD3F0E|nr:trypsin-like peptidase domain-containing protein [Chthonomonas calidirosea]CEK12597.1 trypsin-like serine protease with C-terminal PDZ domain [Chthonomonas calidirosea]